MKIALIGYGKMGKAIEEIALQRGHSVVLKVGSNSKEWEKELSSVDVAIEFTKPSSAIENYKKILASNIPLVTGTTGWYEEYESVKKFVDQSNGTFLSASNFSVGVNLFFEINRFVAQLMDKQTDYDVEIEEIHHLQKIDAPSGTAITIAEGIIENSSKKTEWYCPEKGNIEHPEASDLKITAKREENVSGTHIVSYESEIDEIKIIHQAKSRKGFAFGAILAAEFIQGKKGIYTMKDVLQLSQFNH
ncbi:MAG: 4-hydroxy-tetrahydrodipicolinate reductase [Crocinitomicaceae bacterium]